ncbi:lipopolysaccharide assembly protein LapA domain-containing protein [Solidesulfovibrio alcoholivorans]|uniref:lipopolysaccharide assembly protein LapA domain-containing protein n=1 Tax=Solidesulfovibrio alcoholivorans TaxID=81406 RepID=UPI0004959AE5|nr:LapA family protein [Solidesulfovibrio alcoholivorans]
MRVIKVLFLLVFFFVCMLFFVQNTAILETPLLLKLGAFGYMVQSPAVPFYVVLLIAFVAGGLFCTLYFLAEKVRLATSVRSLQNKVNAMEKQLAAQKKSTVASPLVAPSYAAAAPATPAPAAAPATDKKADA